MPIYDANIKKDIPDDSENIDNQVEIFSNEDERLKFIGEILSNESSRSILKLLISNELSAHEIVQKTNLSLSLIKHHLDKMKKAGIVEISKISQTSRNQDMKHYTAKAGIFILPNEVSQKAKTSKTFQNSLKRIMRFCGIGIAGIASWFITSFAYKSGVQLMTPTEPKVIPETIFWSFVISLIVVIVGLITERILVVLKK